MPTQESFRTDSSALVMKTSLSKHPATIKRTWTGSFKVDGKWIKCTETYT